METYEILDHLVAPWHQNHKLEIAEKIKPLLRIDFRNRRLINLRVYEGNYAELKEVRLILSCKTSR